MTERLAVREFARREGCNEKQVRRAVEKGLLRKDSDGLISADQLGNGWRKTNRRGRDAAAAAVADKIADIADKPQQNVRKPNVRSEMSARSDESAAEAAERIALTAAPFERVEAERIKENYLALLKKLEFEQKEGSLVELEVAERVLFEAARAQRDVWLNWPSRVGPLIAADLGLAADLVTQVLTEHVHKQIAQIGEPTADFADVE
jgi:hypothetical protein